MKVSPIAAVAAKPSLPFGATEVYSVSVSAGSLTHARKRSALPSPVLK